MYKKNLKTHFIVLCLDIQSFYVVLCYIRQVYWNWIRSFWKLREILSPSPSSNHTYTHTHTIPVFYLVVLLLCWNCEWVSLILPGMPQHSNNKNISLRIFFQFFGKRWVVIVVAYLSAETVWFHVDFRWIRNWSNENLIHTSINVKMKLKFSLNMEYILLLLIGLTVQTSNAGNTFFLIFQFFCNFYSFAIRCKISSITVHL